MTGSGPGRRRGAQDVRRAGRVRARRRRGAPAAGRSPAGPRVVRGGFPPVRDAGAAHSRRSVGAAAARVRRPGDGPDRRSGGLGREGGRRRLSRRFEPPLPGGARDRERLSLWKASGRRARGRQDDLEKLRARARRLGGLDSEPPGSARYVVTWSSPELHPALWTTAMGAPMPAQDSFPLFDVAEAVLAAAPGSGIELRLDPDDAARAARLGAVAVVTVIVGEGTAAGRSTASTCRSRAAGALRSSASTSPSTVRRCTRRCHEATHRAEGGARGVEAGWPCSSWPGRSRDGPRRR